VLDEVGEGSGWGVGVLGEFQELFDAVDGGFGFVAVGVSALAQVAAGGAGELEKEPPAAVSGAPASVGAPQQRYEVPSPGQHHRWTGDESGADRQHGQGHRRVLFHLLEMALKAMMNDRQALKVLIRLRPHRSRSSRRAGERSVPAPHSTTRIFSPLLGRWPRRKPV